MLLQPCLGQDWKSHRRISGQLALPPRAEPRRASGAALHPGPHLDGCLLGRIQAWGERASPSSTPLSIPRASPVSQLRP